MGTPTIKYFSTSGYKVYTDPKYIIFKLRIWWLWSTYGLISRTSKNWWKSRFKLRVSGQNRENSDFSWVLPPSNIFQRQAIRFTPTPNTSFWSLESGGYGPPTVKFLGPVNVAENRGSSWEVSGQNRHYSDFGTMSDFSWPNGKRYRRTVFFDVMSVFEFTTYRAFCYDTSPHLLKKIDLMGMIHVRFEDFDDFLDLVGFFLVKR